LDPAAYSLFESYLPPGVRWAVFVGGLLTPKSKIIKTILISGYVPNIKKKLYKEHFPKPKPKPFLQLSQLHEKRPPGYLLIANVLSSMHTKALRKIEPNFRPVLSISCDAPKNVQILVNIMSSLFQKKKKKSGHRTKLKR